MQDFTNSIPNESTHLTFCISHLDEIWFLHVYQELLIAFLVVLTLWECERAFMGDHTRKFKDFIFCKKIESW